MNFSIHLNKELFKKINSLTKKSGLSRNALISTALEKYCEASQPLSWPKEVYDLAGLDKNLKPFEENRKELIPPLEISLK